MGISYKNLCRVLATEACADLDYVILLFISVTPRSTPPSVRMVIRNTTVLNILVGSSRRDAGAIPRMNSSRQMSRKMPTRRLKARDVFHRMQSWHTSEIRKPPIREIASEIRNQVKMSIAVGIRLKGTVCMNNTVKIVHLYKTKAIRSDFRMALESIRINRVHSRDSVPSSLLCL